MAKPPVSPRELVVSPWELAVSPQELGVSPRELAVSPRELAASPWELVVVQLEAGPSGGSPEGDLEWPCPEDPSKVRFVLWDSWERQLWDIFGGQGHAAVSELTKLSTKLESARKQAQFTQ